MTQPPGTSAAAPPEPSMREGWTTLASVVVGLFVVVLDTTIVNVAVPALQALYGATVDEVTWVVSVYVLALGIATPLAGFLGDRFGTKRVFLAALAGFALASAACGLAPTIESLVVARVLQGAAGGIAVPLATARLFTAFPAGRRGLAFGVFSVVLTAAPAIGPALGGALVDADATRWIFLVNVPLVAVGSLVAVRLLREQPGSGSARIDPAGILLAVLGFGALLVGASLAGEAGRGLADPVVLGSLGAGLLTLAALVVVELRVPHPLLDPRLFRIRSFLVGTATNCVGQVAFFGVAFLLPLYLQSDVGLTAFDAGLLLVPLAVASGVSGLVGGRVIDAIGPRLPLAAGLALLGAAALAVDRLGTDAGAALVAAVVAAGLGAGVVPPAVQLATLADVPRSRVNRATSLLQTLQRVAQALGVAVLGTLVAASGFTVAYAVAAASAVGGAALALLLPRRPATAGR